MSVICNFSTGMFGKINFIGTKIVLLSLLIVPGNERRFIFELRLKTLKEPINVTAFVQYHDDLQIAVKSA